MSAETFAKSQLCKGETKKLIEAGKAAQFVIAAVPLDALVEFMRRKVIDQLGEDGAAGKHAPLSVWTMSEPRRGSKPRKEVDIEKALHPSYVIEQTSVIGDFQSDSRTAVYNHKLFKIYLTHPTH